MGFVEFPGATQVTGSRRWHQTYGYRENGRPPVLVVHTVEGRMGQSAIAAHPSPPHLWLDPVDRTIFQTIDLARPALALENPPGAPRETNHRGLCFQIELQLFSDPKRRGHRRHVASLTIDDMAWLGEQVAKLDAISRRLDPRGRGIIPPNAHGIPVLPKGDGGWGRGSSARFTAGQWPMVAGIIGHAHVPQNSHYDPSGDFDFPHLVRAALAARDGAATRPAPEVGAALDAAARAVKAALSAILAAQDHLTSGETP